MPGKSETAKTIPSGAKIIYFTSGLFSFADLTRFELADIPQTPFFKWLQSLERPEVKFLLLDPFVIKDDYQVELDDVLIAELEIAQPDDVIIYTTVTVPSAGLQEATTNLVGPIVINWKRGKGKQVIIAGADENVKYPIARGYLAKASNGG